jgi:hypothetical protein
LGARLSNSENALHEGQRHAADELFDAGLTGERPVEAVLDGLPGAGGVGVELGYDGAHFAACRGRERGHFSMSQPLRLRIVLSSSEGSGTGRAGSGRGLLMRQMNADKFQGFPIGVLCSSAANNVSWVDPT